MIKTYTQYIKEEINWRKFNPFSKNKYYPIYTGDEIDPYGEEDWDDSKQILQKIKKPYDRIITLNYEKRYLTSLNGIENLINLQFLYCDNNQLTSLEGIENLINLKGLSCTFNQIRSLNGIENLTNLNYFFCQNNQLTNLDEIEKLTNLEVLNCHNNQLTSLEGIENLINLNHLSCWNNQFSEEYKEYLKDYCNQKIITLNI